MLDAHRTHNSRRGSREQTTTTGGAAAALVGPMRSDDGAHRRVLREFLAPENHYESRLQRISSPKKALVLDNDGNSRVRGSRASHGMRPDAAHERWVHPRPGVLAGDCSSDGNGSGYFGHVVAALGRPYARCYRLRRVRRRGEPLDADGHRLVAPRNLCPRVVADLPGRRSANHDSPALYFVDADGMIRDRHLSWRQAGHRDMSRRSRTATTRHKDRNHGMPLDTPRSPWGPKAGSRRSG